MQEKRRRPTIAEFETFRGSKELGAFAKAKAPQDIALLHFTPKARTF